MRSVLIVAAATLALAGCNRDLSGQSKVVVHDNDGGAAVIQKAAPPSLPSYAQLYPGGVVTSSLDEAGKGGVLTYTTNAAPDAVVNYYKTSASGAHLDLVMDSASYNASGKGAHVLMFAQKDTKHSLSISVESVSSGTKVGLIYGAS